MILIERLAYRLAKDFEAGELAYDEELDSVYLCVMTDTHRPQAFREMFRRRENKWLAIDGGLRRFGALRLLGIVRLVSADTN